MPDLTSMLGRADHAASRVPLPDGGLERLQRRRDRKRRNQRIAAGIVAIGVFVVPVILFAVSWSDRTKTPGASETEPGAVVIDQAFVESINRCQRLLVGRSLVQSALGFPVDHVAPFADGKPRPGTAQIESMGGVTVGCQYVLQGGSEPDGEVVISAYTADAPPSPPGDSEPVQGIGDEAVFSLYGNRDGHVPGAEGATSMLQVRSGDLILRFNGRVYDNQPPSIGHRLPPLRELAEFALTSPAIAAGVPEVDYMIDLNTGVKMPLPEAILGSVGGTSATQYAVPPDGSLLAYVATGDEGTPQIFIAGIDGTGVRQLTHDPIGASSPAWSPEGTRIAYEGYGSGDLPNIFVLDVATGESTQVTDETLPCEGCALPVFTPDGSSLIYTGGTSSEGALRTVPVTGGKSAILWDPPARGLGHGGSGSLSPDGSLLTFRGNEIGGPGALRFLANADGTDWRIIPDCYDSYPAGTWSPDGSRIVCSLSSWVIVVDIATGEASPVAAGRGAIWLDDHTLLISV